MNGFRARRESMPNLDKFSSWSPMATPTKILSRKLLSSFFRSKLIITASGTSKPSFRDSRVFPT